MSVVVSLAAFAALVLVAGNWLLEACESAATRHRAEGDR